MWTWGAASGACLILLPAAQAWVPRPSTGSGDSKSCRSCSNSLRSSPEVTPLTRAPRLHTAMRSSVIDPPSEADSIIGRKPLPTTPRVPPISRSASSSDVKDELIGLVGSGVLPTTARKRALVNELLIKLEALNPTKMPAYSPLLNGAWEFLYTGGISPGTFGLQIASRVASVAPTGAAEIDSVLLTISRSQPRVEVQTKIRVFGRDNVIKVWTKLEPASDRRLEETYIEASIQNLKVPFPETELLQRPLFVSYLDEDLLVVRDQFGAPDILLRRDAVFRDPNTGVPSATDDDLSPGAG